MHHVFVYGTLRSEFWNHHLIRQFEVSKPIAVPAKIKGALYSLGGFPGYKEQDHVGNVGTVVGELWHVPTDSLRLLDRLEGYDERTDTGWYRRIIVNELTTGLQCYTYHFTGQVQPSNHVTNGDWRTYYHEQVRSYSRG